LIERSTGIEPEAATIQGVPSTDLRDVIPSAPSFSDEEMQRCRNTGDYKPILFEWYKYVGKWANLIGHIEPTSPAFRPVNPQHYHILVGLLNRCTRLMLSNVALSHEGKFGETTAILDRCIFESAVKIIWLCHSSTQEEFDRYIADGLKTEFEFKDHIAAAIAANNGEALPIESRMLSSIERHVAASGMTESQARSTPKLRDIASMLDALGFGRIFYVIGQKIGSHHVHGTWSSLYLYYLQKESNQGPYKYGPRGHDCDTHLNQYAFVPRIVLRAMKSYVFYMLQDVEANALRDAFHFIDDKIEQLFREAGDDAR
jgi:hypothetical protein